MIKYSVAVKLITKLLVIVIVHNRLCFLIPLIQKFLLKVKGKITCKALKGNRNSNILKGGYVGGVFTQVTHTSSSFPKPPHWSHKDIAIPNRALLEELQAYRPNTGPAYMVGAQHKHDILKRYTIISFTDFRDDMYKNRPKWGEMWYFSVPYKGKCYPGKDNIYCINYQLPTGGRSEASKATAKSVINKDSWEWWRKTFLE